VARNNPFPQGKSMKPSVLFEALSAFVSQLVPLRIWEECGVEQNRVTITKKRFLLVKGTLQNQGASNCQDEEVGFYRRTSM
jgi:hypothetical protein